MSARDSRETLPPGFTEHDWRRCTMPCHPESVVDALHTDGSLTVAVPARWMCWGVWTSRLNIVAWKLSDGYEEWNARYEEHPTEEEKS